MTRETDIFISGGGIAGLIAAAAFGRAGFSVVLADPAPPPESQADEGSDLRSTAYLRPAIALLERAGLWEALAPDAAPLDALEVIDTTGWPPRDRARRRFESADLGQTPFGWNLVNWRTRKTLAERLAGTDRVSLRLGTGYVDHLARDREALVRLSDGSRIRARLVIGADGRASPVRATAGIGTEILRYGQKALAFAVTHPLPHGGVSTEIYNQGGAFTLVPLPDHAGRPASAVVWMNDGPRAVALAALPPAELEAEMTTRALALLGPLTLASPVRSWPVVTQWADRLTARRTALVAEAAHVLPPIGAQGLNTSLQDVTALLDLAVADPGGLGGEAMLAAYETARARDIHARARAIDLFNRVCRSGAAPVQTLRLTGLKAVHDLPPLRRGIMRAGMGPGSGGTAPAA